MRMLNRIYSIQQRTIAFLWGNRRSFRSKDKSYILMFHKVASQKTSPSEYIVNVSEFEKYIDWLLENETICSLNEIISGKNQGVAITFDDGFEEIANLVHPLFERKGVPYTIFLTSGYVGKPGYLSLDEVVMLSKSEYCTIGSHSVSHTKLRKDKNSYQEIAKSKHDIEIMINKNIDFFAYPYGSVAAVSLKNMMEVKRVGYKNAFSAIPGFIPVGFLRKRFLYPRINGDERVIQYMEKKDE